jgi:hypothetical protein
MEKPEKLLLVLLKCHELKKCLQRLEFCLQEMKKFLDVFEQNQNIGRF